MDGIWNIILLIGYMSIVLYCCRQCSHLSNLFNVLFNIIKHLSHKLEVSAAHSYGFKIRIYKFCFFSYSKSGISWLFIK